MPTFSILKKLTAGALGAAFMFIGTTNNAQAAGIVLDGFGGSAGFGELALGRNDDSSSNELNLPFEINFFGNTFNTFYINNNGNLTFRDPLGSFTPEPFPVTNQPMIAPYWADVDTSCQLCGEVYVASPNPNTVVVTWKNVGYFPGNSTKANTFQTVLRNRSDTGAGNFDIEYRYGQLQWTTGDASGGTDGLGGTPAQAGFDAGDNTNYLTLPGSRTNEVLNLQNLSNLTDPVPGLWSFAIRNGQLPGSTPENPLLPIVIDGAFVFDFNIGDPNRPIFIDPIVAVGYDYIVDSGPNFASVLLPENIGDGLYDLWTFDDVLQDFVDAGIVLTGGDTYNFGGSGVNRFRILGIEPAAELDPNDPTAFVTGLTFTGAGQVQLRQIPITEDTDIGSPRSVPEPSTILSLCLVAGFGAKLRKMRSKQVNNSLF
ncbi:MAG TPA: PEP-CTERM sorting domain-containing protein [Trichormus sp. M33_DOE_039]|nr:PEP-CTERM sorting domain-containing protein [Trichormus sp. M33_DOE_039]